MPKRPLTKSRSPSKSPISAAAGRMRARRLAAAKLPNRRARAVHQLTCEDLNFLTKLSPSQRDAYYADASACANAGVPLSPQAWRLGEDFERVRALCSVIPDHAPPDAVERLTRAIVDIWPALKGEGAERAAHLHEHVQQFGLVIVAPDSIASPELRQHLVDGRGVDTLAVYIREPIDSHTSKGFCMLKPRDAPLPSRERLRAMQPSTRRLLYKELGWRKF